MDNEKYYSQTIEEPLNKGTYYLEVQVTNKSLNISNESYLLLLNNDGTVSITSLKATLSSPQPTNKSIKWTATAKGANLQISIQCL